MGYYQGEAMKVKDIMLPVEKFVGPENTIREAVKRILSLRSPETNHFSPKGIPVIEDDRLLGIISMMDILKAVYPAYMEMMDLGEFTWDGMVESLAKEVALKKVRTCMKTIEHPLREEDPLMECIDYMIKHEINCLPVIDNSGKLTGIVYEDALFLAVTKAMLEDEVGIEK
jgi:CBS domain-containing protein